MRSHIVISALMGIFAQFSAASTCTSANATPVEQLISSGSSSSGGPGGNPAIFLSYDIFGIVSNAVKRSATPDAKLAKVLSVLRPRAEAVECSALEMCLSVQGSPFCLNAATGDFHDGSGTTGNALSGDYTLGDGRKGNLYKGPYPVPEGAVGAGLATTTTGTGTGATGASSPTPTQTGSTSMSQTVTPNAGGRTRELVAGSVFVVIGALLL